MISMFSNKIKINYGLSIIEKKVGDVSVLYTNQTSNGSYNEIGYHLFSNSKYNVLLI